MTTEWIDTARTRAINVAANTPRDRDLPGVISQFEAKYERRKASFEVLRDFLAPYGQPMLAIPDQLREAGYAVKELEPGFHAGPTERDPEKWPPYALREDDLVFGVGWEVAQLDGQALGTVFIRPVSRRRGMLPNGVEFSTEGGDAWSGASFVEIVHSLDELKPSAKFISTEKRLQEAISAWIIGDAVSRARWPLYYAGFFNSSQVAPSPRG